ncbi:hypothetical protein C8J57DRAFT_1067745 [Mycena rebaudengoi]|nr:hypothetical protein C8J57DRAFT_1067745 [Mycena rebaudengoi]
MQPNFNTLQGFPASQNFLPQTQSQEHSLHQGADPNSPELFNQNMKVIRQNLISLQEAAKRTLVGMRNAYHTGQSPIQTEADLATLKQMLTMISDMMRHSGVGGLPLLPSSDQPPILPTEDQMLVQTTRAVGLVYDQLKRGQDSAAVVANLLSSADHTSRPPPHR